MNQDERQADERSGVRLAPGVVVSVDLLRFSYSASRGPGGQNVNKRQTKAELRTAIESLDMPAAAKARLARLAEPWLTDEGDILIVCDEFRSQSRNREGCVERLSILVRKALVPPKPRKKTRPTKGSVQRRLSAKRARGERKRERERPGEE